MSSPLPVVQYLVAFQNAPTDDPATITSVASPGVLGTANVWTDITAYVRSHRTARGRQHELSQFEAGTLELELGNDDHRFDAWNASGPYYGYLLPRKLVQVRATWGGTTYYRFTGHVTAWPNVWDDPVSTSAKIEAADALRFLNQTDMTSTGYPTAVIKDGASAYYRLGDPAGSQTAADSGPNGYHGTLSSGYIAPHGQSPGCSALGTFGNAGAMVMDTTTSALIGVPAGTNSAAVSGALVFPSTGVTIANDMTIEFWIKPSASTFNLNTGLQICAYDGTTSSGQPNNAYITTQSSPNTLVAFNTKTVGHAQTTSLVVGVWQHVAVVFTAAGGCTIYVNGVAASTVGGGNVGQVAYSSVTDSGGTLIQDLAFYPSALTAAQVANHYSLAALPQQASDVRVGQVLTAVGWSAGARSLDAGSTTVQAVTSSIATTSSLSHLQQVEATEGGALYVTGDGKVRLVSRQSLFSGSSYTTSQQTIGDNVTAGDLPFQPGTVIGIDDIDLYNEATSTRQGGVAQRAVNAASILANGRQSWQPAATPVGISDAEELARCQYVVGKDATPQVRVQSVTVDLIDLIAPNKVANLLSLGLLDRVTVRRTSSGFSQQANIEHIQETVTPNSWTVTFGLSMADPALWVLGVGQLGSTTTLAY